MQRLQLPKGNMSRGACGIAQGRTEPGSRRFQGTSSSRPMPPATSLTASSLESSRSRKADLPATSTIARQACRPTGAATSCVFIFDVCPTAAHAFAPADGRPVLGEALRGSQWQQVADAEQAAMNIARGRIAEMAAPRPVLGVESGGLRLAGLGPVHKKEKRLL